MNYDNFLPTADREKSAWLQKFASKLPGYAEVLEVSEEELASAKSDSEMFAYLYDLVETSKLETRKRVAFKNSIAYGSGIMGLSVPLASFKNEIPDQVSPGIFRRIVKIVNRIKLHPSYTESIGHDLGIYGSEMLVDVNKLKPELKITLDAGKPIIMWTYKNVDSIDIYVQRLPLTDFEFLANDTQQEFTDMHPLPISPRLWSYRAVYRIGDEQVGQVSNTVSISVMRSISVGINY